MVEQIDLELVEVSNISASQFGTCYEVELCIVTLMTSQVDVKLILQQLDEISEGSSFPLKSKEVSKIG